MPVSRPEALIRGIALRQLAAAIVNSTIGAGIFLVPALVAQGVGAAAPLAYLACAATMALIVTSIAVAGSRVAITGGLFAYVEAAFGPFVGFLTGSLLWLGSLTAVSGVSIALLDALGSVLPGLRPLPARAAVLAAILATFASINVRGVRMGSRAVECLTAAKLLPLAVFVVAGVFAIQPSNLAWAMVPSPQAFGRTVLLLVFAFTGIEVALAPSGEIQRPAVTVPRAIFIALAVTTTMYIAIQTVALGVLGAELAAYTEAPLAAAGTRFLGAAGGTLMLAGAIVSTLGYMSGDMLSTPRLLFAFARDGFIAATFASVHERFRTPQVAICVHAVLVFAVAMSGTFAAVAIISNLATLAVYLVTCVASIRLTQRDVRTDGAPLVFHGSTAVAVAAVVVIVAIMASATRQEFAITGAVLAAASVLYLLRARSVAARVADPAATV